MALYLRELSYNKKTFFIWAGVLIALNLMVFALYPSFKANIIDLENILKSYPEVLVKLVGGDSLDMSDILHFYAIEIYLTVTLIGSIYAMLLGSAILSREEDDGTMEFLLARPISREKIITFKALGVLSYVVFFNMALMLSTYIMLQAFGKGDYSFRLFTLLSLGVFLLHLTFAYTGFMISVFIKKARASISISLGVVFGTYALSAASSISSKMEVFKYFSPFKYVEAASIIGNGRIESVYLIIISGIIIATIGSTYFFFHKKDIYS